MKLTAYSETRGTRRVKTDKKTGEIKSLPFDATAQYTWVEKSYIFGFPIKYYYLVDDQMKTREPNFNMFLNGFPFFFILSMGGVYGVFFKKRKNMDVRAAVFCFAMGALILLLGRFAYG